MSASATIAHPSRAILRPGWWWGFALYGALSVLHIVVIVAGWSAISTVTKLVLMPALALAVFWASRGWRWAAPLTLLMLAIGLSWLGDGAGTFFPFAPEIPMMLLWFGLAHLCYIWLFWRHVAIRRLPLWAAVYAVWWVAVLLVLWPHLGGLAIAVAIYGLVLGGTAASATRCAPLIAIGGAFFLASDTILAFRLFYPGIPDAVASPVIMLTYCLGQGLIAAGVVIAVRRCGAVRVAA